MGPRNDLVRTTNGHPAWQWAVVGVFVCGCLFAAALFVVSHVPRPVPDDPAAARRESLEREADDWARKGTVLPHERGSFQAFVLEYRREFGRNWDDPPPKR